MIFFSVWLRVYSREVLRELFQLPKNVYYNRNFRNFRNFRNAPTLCGWAFGLDLFQPSSQRNEPSPKTPATPTHPNAHGLGFGLADLFHRTNPTQRAVKPKTPALPTNRTSPASGLTSALLRRTEPGLKLRTIPPAPRFRPDLCPPSSDRARPEAPHNPTRPPLRSATLRYDELFLTPV